MKSLPTETAAGGALAPSAIDQEILRLQQEREKLLERRAAVKRETLLSLADAFARKLQAAGLTVREGIQALRPYEHLKLNDPVLAYPQTEVPHRGLRRTRSTEASAPASVIEAELSPQQAVEAYAEQVLGAGWRDWLEQPHLLLGGERPSALLTQRAGVAKVRALLEAFEQGA